MNSNTKVEPSPGAEARPPATTQASPPQAGMRTCDLVYGQSRPTAQPPGAERYSVDPMCETDRYRLVHAMPLPK